MIDPAFKAKLADSFEGDYTVFLQSRAAVIVEARSSHRQDRQA